MIKIDELKQPPVIGEYYLVPCILEEVIDIKKTNREWIKDEQGEYFLEKPTIINTNKFYYIPIINHPHNDIENGQKQIHYHIDDRFVKSKNSKININTDYKIRIDKTKDCKIEYIVMKCTSNKQHRVTKPEFIKNSKLKHKCIYKGKCAHRGYDLSQEIAVNGVITCPLHGLRFEAITKN